MAISVSPSQRAAQSSATAGTTPAAHANASPRQAAKPLSALFGIVAQPLRPSPLRRGAVQHRRVGYRAAITACALEPDGSSSKRVPLSARQTALHTGFNSRTAATIVWAVCATAVQAREDPRQAGGRSLPRGGFEEEHGAGQTEDE